MITKTMVNRIMGRLVEETPAPAKIPGMAVWYRSDVGRYQTTDTSTPNVSAGQPVGRWEDQSANERHVLQPLADARAILAFGGPTNGPLIRFDGVDDHLLTDPFAAALVQPNTLAVVATMDGGDPVRVVDGIVGTNRHILGHQTGSEVTFAGSLLQGSTIALPIPLSYWVATFNGITSVIRRNGTQTGSGNTGTQSVTGLTLGADVLLASGWLDGDIAEVILYNRLLDAGEIGALEFYFAERYGI